MAAKRRSDLRYDNVIREIENKAFQIQWSKALPCPNRKTLTDHNHNINCPHCENGYVYIEPLETIGMIQTFTLKEDFIALGQFDMADALLTVKPEIKLSKYDKIILTKSETKWIELRERSDKSVDKTRYPIVNPVNLINKNNNLLKKDIDYQITLDGRLKWIGKQSPKIGEIYSIGYTFRPIFIVVSYPHWIRKTSLEWKRPKPEEVDLPIAAVIRYDFITSND